MVSKKSEKINYKECKIEITKEKFDYGAKIDGKTVKLSRDSDTGAYYCSDIPYQTFGSPEILCKAIVDEKESS